MCVFQLRRPSSLPPSLLLTFLLNKIDDYDVIAGRNNICKLFGWLLGAKEAWRIDAETLNNKRKTLFMGRRDLPVVHSDSDAAAFVQ